MTMITQSKSGAGLVGSLLSGPMAVIEAMAEAIRFRRTLRLLEDLDDRMLKDIGLTRGDLFDLRIASSPVDTFATLRRLRLYR